MWQPIETAPKDAIIVASWMHRSKTWNVGEAYWVVDGLKDDEGSWWWANIGPGDYHGDDIVNIGGMPMYWQPLPTAPSYDLNPTDPAHGGKIATD